MRINFADNVTQSSSTPRRNIPSPLVLFQVNGRDVSQLAHEDAVAEFLQAADPIIVEVKRRQCDTYAIAALEPPAHPTNVNDIFHLTAPRRAATTASHSSAASSGTMSSGTGSSGHSAATAGAAAGARPARPTTTIAIQTDLGPMSYAEAVDEQQHQMQQISLQTHLHYYKRMLGEVANSQRELHRRLALSSDVDGSPLESPVASCDEELASQLYNDLLHPSIDIEVGTAGNVLVVWFCMTVGGGGGGDVGAVFERWLFSCANT